MIAKMIISFIRHFLFLFLIIAISRADEEEKTGLKIGEPEGKEEILSNDMATETIIKETLARITFKPSSIRHVWVGRLVLNFLSYSTIIIPCFLLVTLVRRKKLLESRSNNCIVNYLRFFVEGNNGLSFEEMKFHKNSNTSLPTIPPPSPPSFISQTLLLCFYVTGLLLSYLTWGVLQERVIVYEYKENELEKGERFKNSQFIVFANRLLAFVVAIVAMLVLRQPTHKAPVYKYLYSSFSNIMSSWCQYEALKFVSFPVQVLAKTSKVIPVMLMGRFVSRRSYSLFEYLTALLISVGVFIFLISSQDGASGKHSIDTNTCISGLVILLGYIVFDSFTSNWQDNLFQRYHMSPLQMMAGVNFFSVLLTFVSLTEQGTMTDALLFSWKHPTFFLHICILSLTSAVGQIFIFATIAMFGPATFTIVMTVRQGLAILLSCIIYGHKVSVVGGLGVAMIFMALFIRIYHKQTNAKKSKKTAARNKPATAPINLDPLISADDADFKITVGK